MEHGYDKEIFSRSGLLFSAFNSSAPQSRWLAYVLPMLTKLHLNLNLRCNDRHSINETSFHERHVASTLSAAINLDCLYISMQSIAMLSTRSPHPTTIFKASLGDCRLPKLKSLVLEGLTSGGKELADFLQASPNLAHLVLRDFMLVLGSWTELVNQMCTCLSLKNVTLDELSDHQASWWGKVYQYDAEDLDEFFLRDGENPFTIEAIIRNSNQRLRWRDQEYQHESPSCRLETHYCWKHQGGERLCFLRSTSVGPSPLMSTVLATET